MSSTSRLACSLASVKALSKARVAVVSPSPELLISWRTATSGVHVRLPQSHSARLGALLLDVPAVETISVFIRFRLLPRRGPGPCPCGPPPCAWWCGWCGCGIGGEASRPPAATSSATSPASRANFALERERRIPGRLSPPPPPPPPSPTSSFAVDCRFLRRRSCGGCPPPRSGLPSPPGTPSIRDDEPRRLIRRLASRCCGSVSGATPPPAEPNATAPTAAAAARARRGLGPPCGLLPLALGLDGRSGGGELAGAAGTALLRGSGGIASGRARG